MMEFLVFMKEWGLPGIIIAILIIGIYLKDRQMQALQKTYDENIKIIRNTHDEDLKEANKKIQEESKLRVSDAKEFTQTALSLHDEITNSVNVLSRTQEETARLCGIVDNFTRTVERLIAKRGGE